MMLPLRWGLVLTVCGCTGTAWGLQVDIRDFGAIDGDQTMVQVDYWTASNLHVHVTRQTKTGKAIQDAIEQVGKQGGGTVYIPAGTWYVYGYINVAHPRIQIQGEGAASVLKSTADAPCTDGYGLLVLGYTEFAKRAQPSGGFVGMAVRDLKLDGNLYARGRPKAEYQLHNLNVYGVVVQAVISNVTSVDAGCDCLNLRFGKKFPEPLADDDCRVVIENCVFRGGFRQAASFCGCHNVTVRDTAFEDAGKPFGGTNPRAGLDIESHQGIWFMWNLQFLNCTFRNNGKYGVVMTGAEDVFFNHCAISAGPDTKEGYLLSASAFDGTFLNSTFDGSAFPGSQVRQLKTEYVPPGCHNRLLFCGNRFKNVDVSVQSDTTMVFHGNTFQNGRLWAHSGNAAFFGGCVPDVFLDARAQGKVMFYGRSFHYDPAGGASNGGRLTGVWYDQAPLAIDLSNYRTENTRPHLVLQTLPSRLEVCGPAEVMEGRTARYTCTAWFADNTRQDVTLGAKWSDNSTAVEMVAGRLAAGRVTGDRTCRITAALGDKETVLDVTIRNRES